MNKKTFVLAGVLAAGGIGTAWAQTNAQLPATTRPEVQSNGLTFTPYGSVDLALAFVNDDARQSHVQMQNGTYYPVRLGVRGGKPLDGGNNFLYQLELGVNDATGTFNATPFRLSYFGVEGPWGMLTLGRQNTLTYTESGWKTIQTISGGQAFGIAGGFGSALMLNNVDFASNAIKYQKYITPELKVGVMYAFGNSAASSSSTDLTSWGITYKTKKFQASYSGLRENFTVQSIGATTISATGTQALLVSGLPGSIGGGYTSTTGATNVAYQFTGSKLDQLAVSYRPTPAGYAYAVAVRAQSLTTADISNSIDMGYNHDVTPRLTVGGGVGSADITNRKSLTGSVLQYSFGAQYSLVADHSARLYTSLSSVTGSGAAGNGYFTGAGGATSSSSTSTQMGFNVGVIYRF